MFVSADTGGLLSLFIGFSLLSVLEIIYFFTIRVCVRSYRRKNSTIPTVLLHRSPSLVFPPVWMHKNRDIFLKGNQTVHATGGAFDHDGAGRNYRVLNGLEIMKTYLAKTDNHC